MCFVLLKCTLKDGKNGRFHVRHIIIKTKKEQSKGNKNAKLTVAQMPLVSVSIIHFQAFNLASLSCDRWLKPYSAGSPSALTWESPGQHDQLDTVKSHSPSDAYVCHPVLNSSSVSPVQYTGCDN